METVREILKLLNEADTDVFLYSGGIYRGDILRIVELIAGVKTPAKNVKLFLTTHGGDGGAAYRLCRLLQRRYSKVSILVFGPCASAGTLAALGADEIVMSEQGELGPLDVQTIKADELIQRGSGLDIFQSLAVLTDSAFQAFERYFLEISSKSNGMISARTAMENARELTVGLFSPIAQQVDPLRLGEMHRAINIATFYGERLDRGNLKNVALMRLVNGYPAHDFVIDIDEAKDLFRQVRPPDELEVAIARYIHDRIVQPANPACALHMNAAFADADTETGDDQGDVPDAGSDPSEVQPGTGPSTEHDESGDAGHNGEPATPVPAPKRKPSKTPEGGAHV